MTKLLSFALTGAIFLALSLESKAQDSLRFLPQDDLFLQEQDSLDFEEQDSLRFYVNVGYITNIKKCSECTRPDAGGSVRIGILTKGKFGFYAGYLWFNEFHPDYADYDDMGYGFVAGIDFLILTKNDFKWYMNAGLFNEKYKSVYTNGRTEIETSIKPDFGVLFNWNHLNASFGWQPSEPHHINFGIGYTF